MAKSLRTSFRPFFSSISRRHGGFEGFCARANTGIGAAALALCSVVACDPAAKDGADATANPADATVQAPPAIILQPQLTWSDDKADMYGTAFIVEHEGRHVIVSAAAFIDTSGAGLKQVAMYQLAKGVENKITTTTETIGLPGRGGAGSPINDLRDDLVLFPVEGTPEGVAPLVLDTRRLPRVGEKVWLPNKDFKSADGHVKVTGEIIDVDPGYVAVALDESIEIQSQTGSPVLAEDGKTVIGIVSRTGTLEDGSLVLWLNPANYVVQRLAMEAEKYPLAEVFPGADSVAASRALEFAFAWPEELKSKVTVIDTLARASTHTARTSSHDVSVSAAKKGWKIERTNLSTESSDGEGPVSLRKSSELVDVLMPGFTISSEGRYSQVLDYRNFKKQLKAKLKTADDVTKELVSDLQNKRKLEKQLWTDWSDRVETWLASQFKTGEAYRLEEEDIVGALGGRSVKVERFINFSDRVACDAGDVERGCIRIDSFATADPESLRAAYDAVREKGNSPLGDASQWPEFDPERIKLRSRVIVLTKEDSLLTHEVRRELVLVIPGSDEASDHTVVTSRVERYAYP